MNYIISTDRCGWSVSEKAIEEIKWLGNDVSKTAFLKTNDGSDISLIMYEGEGFFRLQADGHKVTSIMKATTVPIDVSQWKYLLRA